MGERVAKNGSTIRPVHGIEGSCVGSASSLYVNGSKAVILSDDVTENGGTGEVTEGNNDDVFFNGTSVARRGSWTQTHTTYKSMIQDNYSPNVYIGMLRDGGFDDLSGKIAEIDGQSPPVIEVGQGTGIEVQTRSWRDKQSATAWAWRDPTDGSVGDETYYVYQGEWCDTECWGNHKGLIVFPKVLRDECLGKNIAKIELYMIRNDTQGYYYKQPIYVYTHMYTNLFPNPSDPTVEPTTENANAEPTISNYGGEVLGNDGTGWEINEEKWCTMPSSFNTLLSNGQMTGVALHRPSRDVYMHFNKNVRVRVTFQ